MNKKLSLILIGVIIILAGLTLYTINYIKTVEDSRIIFKIDEIKNIQYKNNTSLFKTDGNKFTFIINGNTIYYDENLTLNNKTGEIIENTLYLRNVNNKYITIWYNEIEYELYKEIE